MTGEGRHTTHAAFLLCVHFNAQAGKLTDLTASDAPCMQHAVPTRTALRDYSLRKHDDDSRTLCRLFPKRYP